MTATATTPRRVQADFGDTSLYNRSYIKLFYNHSEFLHMVGGAGSGKSRFAAQKEIVESFEPTRARRKTLVVRKVANTLKDSCYSELKTVIYEWGMDRHFAISKSPLGIINTSTGVEFLFRGFDDPEKIKSVTGVDRVWYEETTESDSRNELDQLRLRLRGFENVQITLTYNPINIHHYLNTEYHEKSDPRHYIHRSTYRDNEKLTALDPTYGQYIESTKHTNPAYYKVYGLGEWGQNLEGLIYPTYETIADFVGDVQFYGLDFGFNDPCALIAGRTLDIIGQPKKDYIVKELLYETGHTSATLIQRFNALGIKRNIKMVCDNSRPEMIADLRKAGYNAVGCNKYPGSVRDGINAVKKYNLRIVAGSKNLFREIQNFVWNDKDGKLQEEPMPNQVEHLMDAKRYGLEAVRRRPGKLYGA
jgi:phage terminase large subunit